MTSDDFQTYIVISFIILIFIIYVFYLIYVSRLNSKECDYMNTLYGSLNGYLKPISPSDPDCSGNLCDYYVKTAYNACSGGSYKNDFVNICNLKAVLKEGVRCLDFEIYSIDNDPVVSTSTVDDYHVKETYNSVPFTEVMSVLRNYGFAASTTPTYSDPLIIHLRFKSNNKSMYDKLAKIFKDNTDIMLGPKYSFETEGKNLGQVPLLSLQNKIILIVDRTNTTFLENEELLEYVNLTSNSVFMREYSYYDIKNNPDINELTEFNRRGLTIVLPDNTANPDNPSGIVCRANGCQMVAMRYQQVDNMLEENTAFFDRVGYAYVLKPYELRYHPVQIDDPQKQLPQYSYQTRTKKTDYYEFNY